MRRARASHKLEHDGDRRGANEGDATSDTWKQPIDSDKEQSIQAAQSETLRHSPAKNAQLMAKDKELSLEPRPRPEPRCDQPNEQAGKVKRQLEA